MKFLDGIGVGVVWEKIKSNFLAKDNSEEFTPTEDFHPATKKYVDEKAANAVDGVITYENANIYNATLGEYSSRVAYHITVNKEWSNGDIITIIPDAANEETAIWLAYHFGEATVPFYLAPAKAEKGLGVDGGIYGDGVAPGYFKAGVPVTFRLQYGGADQYAVGCKESDSDILLVSSITGFETVQKAVEAGKVCLYKGYSRICPLAGFLEWGDVLGYAFFDIDDDDYGPYGKIRPGVKIITPDNRWVSRPLVEDPVYIAEYGMSSYNEVYNAVISGKPCFVKYQIPGASAPICLPLVMEDGVLNTQILFMGVEPSLSGTPNVFRFVKVDSSGWSTYTKQFAEEGALYSPDGSKFKLEVNNDGELITVKQ